MKPTAATARSAEDQTRDRARARAPDAPATKLPHAALAVLATAACTALAAPPISLAPFALVALAPLAWLVTRISSWPRALLAGALASCATTVMVFHWIPGSVHAFFQLPMPVCWLLFPIYGLIAQPQLVIWAVARWQWRHVASGRALVASAALYAGLDWLLPKLFRDTLGLVFFADPWIIQIADVGGLYSLTFAAVLAGEVACAVLLTRTAARPRAMRLALGTAALWAVILVYGAVRTRQLEHVVRDARTFEAGVIQANIGNVEKEIAAHGDLEGIIGTLKQYGDLSDKLVAPAEASKAPAGEVKLAPPDLLVWPETAYPLAYGAHRSTLDDDVDAELANYVSQRKVPLLFGGYQRRGETEYNSALLLAPDAPGGAALAYHKFHLIPFGEYIPLLGRAKFGTGGAGRTLPLSLAEKNGQPARQVKLGPVICYESLIPAHAIAAVDEGAQVLMNLTNDSWFLSDAEKELHLAMASVRSVETRRAQLRATNTGISALILPTGEIVERGPSDAPAALRYQVPILDEPPTLVRRFGTWTGPAGLVLCMLLLAIEARAAQKRRGQA